MPGAIVIGAGPGTGTSVALRFAREAGGLRPRPLTAHRRRRRERAGRRRADTLGLTVDVVPEVTSLSLGRPRLHAQPAGSWEREVLYSGRPEAAAARRPE